MTTLFEIAAALARREARRTLLLREREYESIHDYHPAEIVETERAAMAREFGVSAYGPPDCGAEWKP